MQNNKLRFQAISFIIYFLLTGIFFIKNAAASDTELENKIIGAIDKNFAETKKPEDASQKIKNTATENTIIKPPKYINASTKEIPFADNEQIAITLSNRDINRILVKNDKIQSVNGPTGLYTAKNDEIGSAYINLNSSDTCFTIFISTVNGHNLSLLVSPRTTPGRTIILEPTSPLLLANIEETSDYQKTLVTLITGMINNKILSDYFYTQIKKPKSNDFYNIADIKEIASYNGAQLLGIVSEIKNKTKNLITIKPSYFYAPGVRAVALSKQIIAPSETVMLYQVISREGNATEII